MSTLWNDSSFNLSGHTDLQTIILLMCNSFTCREQTKGKHSELKSQHSTKSVTVYEPL